MNPNEYIDTLIEGLKISSEFPIQISELEFVKTLIKLYYGEADHD